MMRGVGEGMGDKLGDWAAGRREKGEAKAVAMASWRKNAVHDVHFLIFACLPRLHAMFSVGPSVSVPGVIY